jgi:hypothetical protein
MVTTADPDHIFATPDRVIRAGAAARKLQSAALQNGMCSTPDEQQRR